MNEYTPRTERVRDVYHKWSRDNTGKDGYEEFDRWLVNYQKQVIVSYLRQRAEEIEGGKE
jgi:hypothetical protein